MEGMLDAVDEALAGACGGSSAVHEMPAPEPAQAAELLPAPRWAPQPIGRQDASLQTLPNGRCKPVTAVNSSQRDAVPAEASDLEQSASAAQPEVTADTRAGLNHNGPPDSRVHSSALEAASAVDQRNTFSQLVEGNRSPTASSTPNANHGSQQWQLAKPPEEQGQPRLQQPPHQKQQGTQPQLQRSVVNEPCKALLPPPTSALSSRPVPVSANGPDTVKKEAVLLASDVQRGTSVPDRAPIKDSPAAAAMMHPGTDDGPGQKPDELAQWWPEQTPHLPAARARPDVATGRGICHEPKHADAMRNGYISSPGARVESAADAEEAAAQHAGPSGEQNSSSGLLWDPDACFVFVLVALTSRLTTHGPYIPRHKESETHCHKPLNRRNPHQRMTLPITVKRAATQARTQRTGGASGQRQCGWCAAGCGRRWTWGAWSCSSPTAARCRATSSSASPAKRPPKSGRHGLCVHA